MNNKEKWCKCKFCEEDFSGYSIGKKMNHAKFCEKNPKKEENKEKQRLIIEKNREKITNEVRQKINKSISKAWKDGKYKDVDHSHYNMSQDAKIRASERMKKMRADGIGSFNRRKSVPCDKFKDYLRNKGFVFEEEYKPIKKRQFCIDIAFPEKKIGVEINGNQHYSIEGKLAPYYQKRHDLIVEEGWQLHEIHYANCFNEDFINKLRNDITAISNI